MTNKKKFVMEVKKMENEIPEGYERMHEAKHKFVDAWWRKGNTRKLCGLCFREKDNKIHNEVKA
jgi:hypothetical protein